MNFYDHLTLTDNTRRLYNRNLIALNNDKPPKSLKFLTKTKDILAKLEQLNPNTRRTYIIAIISAVKPNEKKLYEFYYPYMIAVNKQLQNNTKKTEKQEENWMSYEEVMEVQNHMFKYLPKVIKHTTDYDKLLDLVILSLYTLIPPRRNKDYIEMVVGKPEDDKKNYYHDGKFIFNVYKTARTHGSQEETIPEDLQKILDVYMQNRPDNNDNFLVRYNGQPLKTSTDITKRLNKIFGRNISSSMIRNIYLSSKYSDTMNDMKNDVSAMGTSVNVASKNYIKDEK